MAQSPTPLPPTSPPPQAPKPPRGVFTPRIDAALTGVHRGVKFVGRFFTEVVVPPFHFGEIIKQCYVIGVRSLPLITLTGLVTGAVFTMQSRRTLITFGATSWLPSLITIGLVRTMGPLITALICAGKVGSNIGAELGSMKVTEQIEAMEVSAINPYKFLVVPRTIATSLMLPALMLYCCLTGLLASYLSVRRNEAASLAAYLEGGFSSIEFLDVYAAVFKSIVFGFTIGIIACYKGFHASKGTQGVGRAANTSVVFALIAIFLEEILIVQLFTLFGDF